MNTRSTCSTQQPTIVRESKEEEMVEDDIVCRVCSSGTGEASLLLCDGCDRGFHTWCIGYRTVPKGSWYCMRCIKPEMVKVEQGVVQPGSQVYFYGRVSTKGQASFTRKDTPEDTQYNRAGYGTQNSTVLEWALKNGMFINSTWTEANSAFNAKQVKVVSKRPGRKTTTQMVYLPELQKLVSAIEAGRNFPIVVYAVNRFSRNVDRGMALLKRIHDAGSWVYSITENMSSFDPEFATFIKAAEAESQRLSQRVSDARLRIKMQGGVLGQPPFGYTVIRNGAGLRVLKENPIEQVIIKDIKNIYKKLVTRNGEKSAIRLLITELTVKYQQYTWTEKKVKDIVQTTSNKALNTFTKDLMDALE